MRVRYIIAACGAALLVSLAAFSADSASPVADAAERGDKAAIRSLLQQKADVNQAQADGATALQWAAYRNDVEIADLLLAAGANPKSAQSRRLHSADTGQHQRQRPHDRASCSRPARTPMRRIPMRRLRSCSPRAAATWTRSRCWSTAKADVNAKEKLRGTTALMWAAEQAHPETVKALIAAGADVSAATNNDTKGARAYLAPSVAARRNSAQGAGGLGQGGRGRGTAPASQWSEPPPEHPARVEGVDEAVAVLPPLAGGAAAAN